MLERPGAIIPHAENIYGGPKPSTFNVSSVLQSRILTFEATEMAKILNQHTEESAEIVAEALAKEYLGLIDSLKVKPPGAKASSSDLGSTRDSSGEGLKKQAAAAKTKRNFVPKPVQLEMKLAKLEADVEALTTNLNEVAASASAIPEVLAELARRFVAPDGPAAVRVPRLAPSSLGSFVAPPLAPVPGHSRWLFPISPQSDAWLPWPRVFPPRLPPTLFRGVGFEYDLPTRLLPAPSQDTGASPSNSNSESPESTNRSKGGFFG